jgi:hypothetical protein
MQAKMAIFAVFVAFATLVFPAQAGWQFTKWGMTVNQVLSASHGTLHRATEPQIFTDGSIGVLEGKYTAGEFSFRSTFIFSPVGALNGIKLRMPDMNKCRSLNVALTGAYGDAEVLNLPSGRIMEWWNEDGETVILLSDMPKFWCILSYIPYSKLSQPDNVQRS